MGRGGCFLRSSALRGLLLRGRHPPGEGTSSRDPELQLSAARGLRLVYPEASARYSFVVEHDVPAHSVLLIEKPLPLKCDVPLCYHPRTAKAALQQAGAECKV